MLNKLPSELIYVICKHLDLNSIYHLKHVNSKLYNTINKLSFVICKNELNKFKNKIKPSDIQNVLENFCKLIIYNNDIRFNLFNISYNKHVNILFTDVIVHFINKKNLDEYDDKIKLLFLYNFIQIEQFNIYEIDYYIEFIENITHNKFTRKYNDLIVNYYRFVIKSLNFEESIIYSSETNYLKKFIFLSFEQLHKISKWIITPHIMQKLISYKPLDLSTSEIMICCNMCFKTPLKEIVKIKFNMRDDELIGHNYSCIKEILEKKNFYSLQNYIKKVQLILIDKYMYTTDPQTNEKIKIKNYKLNYKMKHLVNKNEKFLINKIFN